MVVFVESDGRQKAAYFSFKGRYCIFVSNFVAKSNVSPFEQFYFWRELVQNNETKIQHLQNIHRSHWRSTLQCGLQLSKLF